MDKKEHPFDFMLTTPLNQLAKGTGETVARMKALTKEECQADLNREADEMERRLNEVGLSLRTPTLVWQDERRTLKKIAREAGTEIKYVGYRLPNDNPMKSRDEMVQNIRAFASTDLEIARILLIGSIMRGDFNDHSDIDLVVYLKAGSQKRLYEIKWSALESWTGRQVDAFYGLSFDSPDFKAFRQLVELDGLETIYDQEEEQRHNERSAQETGISADVLRAMYVIGVRNTRRDEQGRLLADEQDIADAELDGSIIEENEEETGEQPT